MIYDFAVSQNLVTLEESVFTVTFSTSGKCSHLDTAQRCHPSPTSAVPETLVLYRFMNPILPYFLVKSAPSFIYKRDSSHRDRVAFVKTTSCYCGTVFFYPSLRHYYENANPSSHYLTGYSTIFHFFPPRPALIRTGFLFYHHKKLLISDPFCTISVSNTLHVE